MITRYCYIHFQQMHRNDIVLFLLQFTILRITRYRVIMISSIKTTATNQKHIGNWIGFTLSNTYAIMIVANNSCINHKGGENMEVLEMTEKEMMQKNVEEFARLQNYMIVADKESESYKRMKDRYIELKVILTASGINLTELDKIKE